MSLLAALKTDDSIQQETDSVGGGGVLDSGLYEHKVTMAYLQKSKGGALSLVLHLADANNRDVRQSLWVTSGDAKGNLPYYMDKNGEKKYLPGFNLANSLSLLSVGKELAELDTEEKLVNVYSFDAGKEVPTKVDVVVDLIGQEIITGLFKQVVDKRAKDGNGDYQPTGETREENEIDKFFRAKDKMTTAEIRGGAEEAGFYHTWDKKWTGQVRNRATKGAGTNGAPATNNVSPFAGKAGAPAGAPAAQKPSKSLFG